jgi:prophage antirepressor-like protein
MLTKVQNKIFPLAEWEFDIFQDEKENYSFHGATVCDYFGLIDPSVIIQRYVDEDWRFKAPVELGKASNAWMISEPGLYQLAMIAKTPLAKKFQKWVYSEVLPKLRASGGYIMPTATSEQLAGLVKEANAKILALYKLRSVKYKTDKNTSINIMTVFKGGVKEYETQLSSYSTPSLVNRQILIMSSFYKELDKCTIDIDSPLKEAYVRWRDYNHRSDRCLICQKLWPSSIF